MEDILLDYNEKRGWFLEGVMEMTDTTFQQHVEAYLQKQGITEPTHEQKMQARQYCRHASFWEGCTDPTIKWQAFGGR